MNSPNCIFIDITLYIFRYILSIDDEEEIREYVTDLIQGRDGQKKYFIDELVARWKQSHSTTLDPLPLYQKKDGKWGAEKEIKICSGIKRVLANHC